MTFVKRNKDITLSIYSTQQFLSYTVLFQTVIYYVHLILVDGSSHPMVFCKISALEILNFTRTIQCFQLKSLEFIFERFFLGEDRTLICVADLRGFFMFSLDFRNILCLEELPWLFFHCVYFCDTLSVVVDLL